MKKVLIIFVGIVVVLIVIVFAIYSINRNKSSNSVASSINTNQENNMDDNIINDKKVVTYDYEKYKDLPIIYNPICLGYDTSTSERAVGVADYVFVAKVNSILRTEYQFPVKTTIDGIAKTVYMPYTVYSVTVTQNIKGELVKSKDIEVMQYGGLEEDTKSYTFGEGMGFLNVGEYYILLVNTNNNEDNFIIDSPDSVVSLGKTEKNNEIINAYKKAKKNAIVPEGKEVVKSKLYDVSYSE